ncbi:hypothetical protein [Bacillus zhangzhouensis]|uniref:Uncharacterized protein n=1 Tax=Bacillus zhangzhouensis TaxID=1178540 RepID=A0A081L7B2_9BACI|nr:hypothetical protein [Bacillus zhangzhouensis]KEP25138.1 hypothetical protein BA70_11895 [Bacillus zhangzhouensis]
MKNITFFDWTIHLQGNLTAITDHHEKKMVILESSIELNSVIWIDENNNLQMKPTWDCIMTIDAPNKSLTIQQTEEVFGNVHE